MNKLILRNIRLILIILLISLVIFYLNKNSNTVFVNNDINQKPGKCLVVEEKHCKNFDLITSPFSNIKNSFVGYRLPVGTKIFSPVDGFASNVSSFNFFKSQKKSYPGVTISVPNSNIRDAESFYVFAYFESNKNQSGTVRKGDVIGTVSNKTISAFGNYNLIFYVLNRSSGKEDLGKLMNLLK